MSLVPSIFLPLPFFSLYGEYVVGFSFRVVFVYLVTTGWILDISSSENSQTKTNKNVCSIHVCMYV